MSTATVEMEFEIEEKPLFEAGCEFVDGVWLERNMGTKVSEISSEIRANMTIHNRLGRPGHVIDGDAGFLYPGLANGHRRHPDAAFIRKDQVPGGELADGWEGFPPALIVEVISPHNTADQVEQKIGEWLDGGVERVWVVYPVSRHIAVHYPDRHAVTLTEGDTLDGEDVFPGFRMKVASIFPPFPQDDAE